MMYLALVTILVQPWHKQSQTVLIPAVGMALAKVVKAIWYYLQHHSPINNFYMIGSNAGDIVTEQTIGAGEAPALR